MQSVALWEDSMAVSSDLISVDQSGDLTVDRWVAEMVVMSVCWRAQCSVERKVDWSDSQKVEK